MPSIIRRNYKYFFLSFTVIFFFGGRPVEFGQEASFFHGYLIARPVIRVALGVNLEDVRIHASSGMKVYLADANYKLLADDIADVRVKATKEKLSEKFTVLVSQARRRDDAEKTAKDLRARISGRIFVAEDKAGGLEGIFQVRAGDFLTRGEALSFIRRLNLLGIQDAWIVREEVTEPSSKPRWVLINDELLDLDERTTLYLIPSNAQSYLAFDGKNYRGIFVLKGSRRGVLLINILNIEDYLKGVVPGELSPQLFGELEAQKAQAVAARTYALKNVGQFDDLGFDLYDTTASQVYGGMGLEHPQSSRAVEETRGEVAVYRGQLINALYMSTCGGATEDGEAMFGGPQVPYLKSTECVWESERIVALKTGLEVPSVFAEGRNIAADLARLAALNILAPAADPSWYNEKISAEEACAWAVKAAAAAGKTAGRIAPPAEPLTVFGLGRILADAFAWDERVRTLVGKSEADYVTGDWPELRPQDRPLAAFLLTSGIIPANGGRDDRTAPLSRSRAALMIGRALALSRDLYHQGNFKGLSKAAIAVIEDGELKTLRLAPAFSLLRNLDGAAAPISSVEFTGGEVVKWIETEGLVRLLEVPAPPLTNVLDEPSLYHSWQVRVSREDLESRLNQFYPVGKLIDLVPKKRGASKRLTDLLVIGQEGQVHVTGFKISQVLSLRDNLFVVDREKDADGQAGYFIFLGKGWGHGVGLCQVGAFRMAQKGAAYDEILKKYYRGISLRKEY